MNRFRLFRYKLYLFFLIGLYALMPFPNQSSEGNFKEDPMGTNSLLTDIPEDKDTVAIKINNSDSLDFDSRRVVGGLLYNVETNEIVWSKELKTRLHIASLTKMMVVLLAIEDIEAGKYSWDTMVKVGKAASILGGSQVYINFKETYSLEDLVKAAMVASGNDASFQLGEFLGGSQESFIERMNEKAHLLCMQNTQYFNTTGLPSVFRDGEENYSTAFDLLILAKEMLKHSITLDISNIIYDVIQCGRRKLAVRNHNRLVKQYFEVDGFKTGFTNKAGYCLVATAKRHGQRIISIALGGRNRHIRDNLVANMMDTYFYTKGLGRLGEPIEDNEALYARGDELIQVCL